ncbi:MAG: NUDIX domain-containing protein [Chthoniobacterales bacterium]|nr:NUDIX domain-containing protein [Chthoniobacterales bacterium]MCX7712674.1 NUDIX domain-containing protein [Chthoniobacterales bacterium]
MSSRRYRPNVALILEREVSFLGTEVLIGERSDMPGTWQFPQGGAKPGESLLDALAREVEEEIGLKPDAYFILKQLGPYRYDFPQGKIKEGFGGQEQTYFLARLKEPNLFQLEGEIHSEEFLRLRWVKPKDFELSWVAPFKREVYRQLFSDLWQIELKA